MTDIHDLLGAYCTHALDPDERTTFEAHLTTCDPCRSEAAEFREVLAALADAHPVRPPQHLEDAVMGGVRTRGRAPTAESDRSRPMSVTASASAGAPAAARPAWRVSPWRRSASWIAAAAAGAVIFAGGVGLGRSMAPAELTAAGDMAAVVAVASAQDAHVLPVEIMGTTSRVVMSQEMDKAVFLASDLPIPAKGMCYQVWRVLPDGSMESAGLATPDTDGHTVVVLDGGARDVTKYMITMEPPGGSAHPSGEKLAEINT